MISQGDQRYSVSRDPDVVTLSDQDSGTVVTTIPSAGNVVSQMTVKGQPILRWPYASLAELRARPAYNGIPLLAPWANRLDEQAFYANGTRYPFDMALGNVGGAIPIHGFLTYACGWQVTDLGADGSGAWVTSRLDFYRQPAWMKQFPFAHTIGLTHRLAQGGLEVTTQIENLSAEPMPVSIGFHPYFQLTDSPRNDWTIAVAAEREWLLAETKMPTGQTAPIEALFPDRSAVPLGKYSLDHVFSDLVRGQDGRAVMTVRGRTQQIDVALGPNYRAVVIYSPSPADGDRGFICFEPMVGITNALNLAHRGLYQDLQSVPPGGTWQETFWVKPSGF
jgi:aldose 1-epimerase